MIRRSLLIRMATGLLLLGAALVPAMVGEVTVSFAQGSAGGDYEQRQHELAELRARIEESRRRAASLADDEEQQLRRLQALEQEAKDTRRLLQRLEDEERDLQARVETLKAQLAASDSIMAARRAHLAARLRSMYMRGRTPDIVWLQGADDMRSLARRVRAMTALARADRSYLEKVKDEHAELARRRQELDATLSEVYRNHSQLAEQNTRLAVLAEERKKSLQAVRRQRSRWEASVKELEHSAKALEDLLARLEKKRLEDRGAPSTGFAQLKGRLPWPVQGRVTQRFGRNVHPRFKTVVVNKGINIAAPAGAPIRAVAAGAVDYVNWLPGYGKCIILSHGDGWYTLYAHAREIFPAVGATVQAGDVIAEVGDTGSLDGNQLYFEIRHGKEPVNPSRWLVRSSRGGSR